MAVPASTQRPSLCESHVRVRVAAGARKESVVWKKNVLHIAVREKAEANRANTRVVELVARELAVPTHTVRIVKGISSPHKTVLVVE